MNLDQFAESWWNRSAKRANRVESAIRERTLLPVNLDINGIEVRQFNLQHWLILLKLRSPFLVGGRSPDAIDIGTFLWIVSTEYDPRSFGDGRGLIQRIRRYVAVRKRCAFLKRVVQQPRWINFEPRIRKYLKRAFMDSPATAGDGKPIAAGLGASMIHRIASCYHWSRSEIMQLPLNEVFQYLNWIGANQPQFNPLECDINSRYMQWDERHKLKPNGAEAHG